MPRMENEMMPSISSIATYTRKGKTQGEGCVNFIMIPSIAGFSQHSCTLGLPLTCITAMEGR
jgi:hypothetical protein